MMALSLVTRKIQRRPINPNRSYNNFRLNTKRLYCLNLPPLAFRLIKTL